MPKVSVFVDVQNVYYTTRSSFGKNFDYNRFWAKVSQQHTITQAFAYAINKNDEKQKQFQNILRAIGFEVKLKPFIQRADGSAKGDWDVGIAVDMMECAAYSEAMILVSGDGDFDILVTRIQQKYGIPVEVYGTPALTAASLQQAATRFIPIDHELLL
ncbi:NYN domain-containing protein [Salinimonas marina]|uniref:NYN domain-containing protein n=1 Tax=Salinimonas marina TaxID=2785918 RepID=A0A7S9DWX6_9ALTE|nr:NYN domain-containing protein [Salinimonas marina]QPG05342.1 NYN domain-containing protein [Salinimonas marina]